jgi:hypothetical protein
MKDGIVELHDKGASPPLIRELLLTVDVSISIDTIARFLAEMSGEKTVTRRAGQAGNRRSVFWRIIEEQSETFAGVIEPSSAPHQTASRPQSASPSGGLHFRDPRLGRSEQSSSERAFDAQAFPSGSRVHQCRSPPGNRAHLYCDRNVKLTRNRLPRRFDRPFH